MTAADYAVTFPAEVPLDQRVLWPATPAESNGMEDARFVRFVGDDGESDLPGHLHRLRRPAHRRPHDSAAATSRHFEVAALRGPAARNKGMALFPRTVGGRHLALCRSDGETIGLTTLRTTRTGGSTPCRCTHPTAAGN